MAEQHYLAVARGPALDAPQYTEGRLQLAGEERPLLYSDGLIERRRTDLAHSLEDLRTAVQAGPAGAQALDDAVLAALTPAPT